MRGMAKSNKQTLFLLQCYIADQACRSDLLVVLAVGGVSKHLALHDGLDDSLQHPPSRQLAAGGGHWQEMHCLQDS